MAENFEWHNSNNKTNPLILKEFKIIELIVKPIVKRLLEEDEVGEPVLIPLKNGRFRKKYLNVPFLQIHCVVQGVVKYCPINIRTGVVFSNGIQFMVTNVKGDKVTMVNIEHQIAHSFKIPFLDNEFAIIFSTFSN